jgi:phage-related minor tail protein
MLLTFTNIGKDVFPDTIATVLDMSTALGQDLKSSSIQLGKALNDPILGVSALRKVGVNFTESQKDQIKVLVESGKTMEAQKLILKELATEFGGSATAQAQTFAGKITQLKEKMGDLQEGIGMALVPVIEKLLTKISPVVDKIIVWIEKNPELVKNILIWGGALAGIVAVIGVIGIALPGIIAGFTALGAVFTFLSANPIVLVIAGLALIANSLKNQIAKLYGVEVTWMEVWSGIKDGFKSVTDWIADRILWIMDKIDMVKNAYHKVVDTVSSVGKGIGNAVSSVGSAVGSVFTPPASRMSPLTAQEANAGGGQNYNIVFNGDITDKNEFIRGLKNTMSQMLQVKTVMP